MKNDVESNKKYSVLGNFSFDLYFLLGKTVCIGVII